MLPAAHEEATITHHLGTPSGTDVLPGALGTALPGFSTYVTRSPIHILLCPQVPSPPSPTWPRAWPGTWTDCRWMRSTTTGRRSGGDSSRRVWARGSGRACPGWASACSVRGCWNVCSGCPLAPARDADSQDTGGWEVHILSADKAEAQRGHGSQPGACRESVRCRNRTPCGTPCAATTGPPCLTKATCASALLRHPLPLV